MLFIAATAAWRPSVEAAREPQAVAIADLDARHRRNITSHPPARPPLGYAAIEAADGVSGPKVLQSDVRIDLLITDVGLPGGVNGRQMADAARQLRPALKVLFITGYAENAAIGKGQLEPNMHVLSKPFAMEMLASRIKAIITQG